MKKLSMVVVLTLGVVFLIGCSKTPPDLTQRQQEENQAINPTQYTGEIGDFELNVYKDGTHQITTDEGEVVVIQSSKVNLNNYVGKKVTIQGLMQKMTGTKSEVFTVEKITLDSNIEGAMKAYKSTTLGFQLSYPEEWILSEESGGISFSSNGHEWLTITAFGNIDVDLDTYVKGKEVEDGTPVTIGSQRSLRFINDGEIRIYTPNKSKNKVYRLIFNQKGDENGENKSRFYNLLEGFQVLQSKVLEGEACGGKKALACPETFRCELENGDEDAEGVCVPVDEAADAQNCPFVPKPAGCQDYSVKNTNKDGCPTSYVCNDLPEKTPELTSQVPADENADNSEVIGKVVKEDGGATVAKKVVEAFENHKSSILPEGEVVQFEVADSGSLLAVDYTLDELKYRAVFSYSQSADEFNFVKKADYEQGEERDWVLTEGEETPLSSAKTIIKPTSGTTQVIADGMRLYENSFKSFSLQYPRNWYYRSFGSVENTVWTVGFGTKSLDHMSDATVSVVILDEKSAGKKEMKDSRYLVEVPRDKDSHFLVEGPLEEKENIDAMAASIVQE